MAVISPIFSNWAVKISHKIFGKPTNSILDPVKSEPEQTPPVPPAQQTPAATTPGGNLVDILNNKYKNQTNPIQPQNTQSPAQKPSPAGNLVNQVPKPAASQSIVPSTVNGEQPIKRTYIPNPVLQEETVIDPALQAKYNEINAAILQAEQAEMQAANFLRNL